MQTRGFGGTARFTLPGMEKRRKRGQDKTLADKEKIKYEPDNDETAGEEAEERFDQEDEEPGTTSPGKEEGNAGLSLAESRAGLEDQLMKNRPMTRSRLTFC